MPKVLNVKDGARPGRDAVYIGRPAPRYGLRGSKWQNPFKIPRDGTRDQVWVAFEEWLFGRRPSPPGHRADPAELMAALPELRGKDLICWCAPERCHGEVLLRLANG
jgi:hypothetical protein